MTPFPGHTLTLIPANSTSIQLQTTPVLPTSCEEPIDFVVNDQKDKQIDHLNSEVKTLQLFIFEELYVFKKTIEGSRQHTK